MEKLILNFKLFLISKKSLILIIVIIFILFVFFIIYYFKIEVEQQKYNLECYYNKNYTICE